MNTAIVLGATGLVGRKLVDRLAKESGVATVVAVTKRPVNYTSKKIVNEVINFDQLEKHRDIFSGDVFFHALEQHLSKQDQLKNKGKSIFTISMKLQK